MELNEGRMNRAIGLWESWHEKQQMLELVFGGGISGDLDKEKFRFLSAGAARIAPGANADEKLVLAMLRKTTKRLEKQLYPNPVVRVFARFKSLVYDRPLAARRFKQLKADNITALNAEFRRIDVDAGKLDLETRLDFDRPKLDISLVSPFGSDQRFDLQLHLERDDKGAYQLSGYTGRLKDPLDLNREKSFTFRPDSEINVREALNLLQGRPVMKHVQNGLNRMGSKWMQLDSNAMESGKGVLKEMGADYEFNLRREITQAAKVLDKPELDSVRVLDGLQQGNQVVLRQVSGEVAFLEANALGKALVVRDVNQQLSSLEKVAAKQKELAVEKPKVMKISKTQKKQQEQNLHIS